MAPLRKTAFKAMKTEAEHCPVCYEEIKEATRHKLPTCSHSLCSTCFPKVASLSSLCPMCRRPFCVVRGNQPDAAEMSSEVEDAIQLPGYEGCGTIIIYYTVQSGIQTVSIALCLSVSIFLSVCLSGSRVLTLSISVCLCLWLSISRVSVLDLYNGQQL